MSLQTQTLNCLACHILAKHPPLIKNKKVYSLTSIKTKKSIINPANLITIVKDKAPNSSIKNPLRKIA